MLALECLSISRGLDHAGICPAPTHCRAVAQMTSSAPLNTVPAWSIIASRPLQMPLLRCSLTGNAAEAGVVC